MPPTEFQGVHLHLHSDKVTVNITNLNEPILKEIKEELVSVRATLATILEKEEKLMIDLVVLQAEVMEVKTVNDSVVALLTGLSAKLAALAAEVAGNPAAQTKINELATNLDLQSKALAAAVLANTPVTDPPVQP